MSKTATIVAVRDNDLSYLTDDISSVTAEQITALPVWAGPRPVLEDDLIFRQIIPYVVVQKDGKILRYRRAVSGGEARLHGKISIGVGGHIDIVDADIDAATGAIDLLNTIFISAAREIEEEIGVTVIAKDLKIIGIIRAHDTPVDAVHAAIVILCDISSIVTGELTFEDALDDIVFSTKDEIVADAVEKETWTRLALQIL